MKSSRVFQVVLCGGSARIPKLQQLIKDIFPNVELLNSIPPDEVIPIGAAIEAGILLGRENPLLEEEALFIECSAKDILLKVRLSLLKNSTCAVWSLQNLCMIDVRETVLVYY